MADFNTAIPKLLELEGGSKYTDRPDDSGGPTKYGISKSAYPHLDIYHLTEEQAVAIYHRDYWSKYLLDQVVKQDIAEHIFSMLVNMGAFHSIVIVQRACNNCGIKVASDGKIGPDTIRAINQCLAVQLLRDEIIIEAIRYYLSLRKPRFLAGWINRELS